MSGRPHLVRAVGPVAFRLTALFRTVQGCVLDTLDEYGCHMSPCNSLETILAPRMAPIRLPPPGPSCRRAVTPRTKMSSSGTHRRRLSTCGSPWTIGASKFSCTER
eukprot:scaffold7165_cov115-Isochrysis_galbana.AAC.1